MPSSYTTNIAIEKPAKGEKDQTWGAVVNRNMDIVDRLTSQIGSIALTSTSYTLSVSSVGLVTEGHYSMVKFTGSPGGTCTVTVSPNSVQRIYTFINSSDQTVTIAQGSGSTVDIVSGAAKLVYCDGAGSGAAVVDVSALINPSDISAGDVSISGTLTLGGTDVTSTAAELNLLDGVTWTLTDFNTLTATAAELNILDGVTATTAELNTLDGITATVTELNYSDGVTSNIQTQLDGKQTIDATLTAYAGTLTAAGKVPYATATDTAGELDFVDEDDMASDSATAIPSQQSVKAYVDAEVSAIPGGVGYSQSWQDVKASRSTNTSYQNTTGKPIEVKIQIGSSNDDYFQVSDDGVNWITLARSSSASFIEMGGIIPADHYYRLNGTVTINYWVELR